MTRSNTPARRHAVRAIAVTAAVGLATTVAATAGGGPAGASAVYAQSVGRFLDGAAGGRPIQALVDLHDARAGQRLRTTAEDDTVVDALDRRHLARERIVEVLLRLLRRVAVVETHQLQSVVPRGRHDVEVNAPGTHRSDTV